MDYKTLNRDHYYIDKTAKLEEALCNFSVIYMEGAAASGKTTAVKMLLHKMQKKAGQDFVLTPYVFDMHAERKNEKAFLEKLLSCKANISESGQWVIFENLHTVMEKHILNEIVEYIVTMKEFCYIICISREEPPVEFLQLIWNCDMEQITMADLTFSRDEVARMLEHSKSQLHLEELYRVTGGWAGCVDLMIRYSVKNRKNVWEESNAVMTVSDLRKCYEIATYIREYIMSSLSIEEDMLLKRSQVCPWMSRELCREVWGLQKAELLLDKLTRKGFLIFDSRKRCWKTAPLFRKQGRAESGFWKQLGAWYEKNQYIKEALDCYSKSGIKEAYKDCMIRHYTKIPYNNIEYGAVMSWKDYTSEMIYLRAMYCYENRDFKSFEKEVARIIEKLTEPDGSFSTIEIFINLQYVNVNVALDEWLELLKKNYEKENQKFSLYQIQGYSPMALCGLRDLTELFCYTKKEENRKQRIWKECLSEKVWHYYLMARMEYYLETERRDLITQEEEDILHSVGNIQALNLLIKIHIYDQKEEPNLQIEEIADVLSHDDNRTTIQTARFLESLYFSGYKRSENLIRWIRYEEGMKIEITEDNYGVFSYLTKGYMQLHQYDKAKKILSVLIPYLKIYRRGYPLAEHLYQMAIIRWEENHHGQALQYMIESFLISRQTRYVGFYASYGKRGIGALENYIQWMQANAPDGWHRKKKYQYGNVLRMPEADYMGVIMRCIKRQSRVGHVYENEGRSEHLTMMETIILQDINRGLTNTEICEDLNLKLPTVKTHIYSLYKKLGVNTRVQAIIKGKEQGLIE